jgi:glycosyltransferase involved in cell wall biosynthesis
VTAGRLRVCLDARLRDGESGGVQQFVMGLASGLSRLDDGDEEYAFLSYPSHRGWLEPHVSGTCRMLDAPEPAPPAGASRLPRAVRVPLAAVYRRLLHSHVGARLSPPLGESDGTVERSGADLMHFTVQDGFRTALPTIYQPYDLQHVHLPQFFSPYVRRWRAQRYGALAAAARAVVVMSSWVKDDVVRQLAVPAEKVMVIPWAPVTQEYPVPSQQEVAALRTRLELPATFALYPAQTYPHKNHLALVDAIRVARSRGVDLHVVCPGKQNDHYPAIARHARRLGVAGRITFVGYVTALELQCLYRLARMVVFPSLFEGGGMPIFEAFATGVAVACSNVTCIPQQAGDAAVLFDPSDPASIAEAMVRLWNDDALRAELARRGAQRVARFTWDRTARTYRALYRRIGGRALTADDSALLQRPPET